MKHPFHIVLSNSAGDALFTATKNQIQVFSTKDGSRIGLWIDDVDQTEALRLKIMKERERQLKENAEKEKENGPSKKKRKSSNSAPKLPTPGTGAPTVYNYVRALQLTNDESHLVCAIDSDKSAIIFKIDLSKDNCLELIKRQPFPKRPSAITCTTDGSTVLLGDKFGDVYEISVDAEEAKEVNSETDPVLGHVSMLTDLTLVKQDGQEYLITCDRDEHIRISQYPEGHIIKSFLFGHEQFVNTLLVPSFQTNVLISGGGDDYLLSWDWTAGKQLDKLDVRSLVEIDESHLAPSRFQNEQGDLKEIAVSQLVELQSLNAIGVLVESTKSLLIIKLDSEGKLSLFKTVKFEDKAVAITKSDDKIIVSLDSDSKILQAIDLSTLELVEDATLDEIISNSTVEIESREELYPLYTTNQLRKRSEH